MTRGPRFPRLCGGFDCRHARPRDKPPALGRDLSGRDFEDTTYSSTSGTSEAIGEVRSYVELCAAANKQIVLHDMLEDRYTQRPTAVLLYRRLCRHYCEIDPVATVSYVNTYRELWDSPEQEQPASQ